jgi:hypothetical protein
MTIPTTYRKSTTGGAFTESGVSVGGVAIGISSATTTTAGSPITRETLVLDNGMGVSETRRSVVVENTGLNNGAFNTTKILSGGTFAYSNQDPQSFMIRGVATGINNVASTVLTINASRRRQANHNREKMFGAKTLTAWRGVGWNSLGVANQRSNFDAAGAGVNTHGILDSLNSNYVLPSDGSTASADEALFNGATPAGLTFKEGSLTPTQDDYKVRNLR